MALLGRSAITRVVILCILSLIWGSSFILMKRGLLVFSALHVAALRIVISGIVLMPFAIFAWYRFDKQYIHYVLLCGILGNAIPAILFALAQRHLHSATTALLNSLTPIFTLLVGAVVFGFGVRRSQVWGVILGFIGASALVMAAQRELTVNEMQQSLWYALLPVVATLCYGLNGNILSRYVRHVPPMTVNSIAITSAAWLFIPYLVWSDFCSEVLPMAVRHPHFTLALGSIVVLSVLGTALSNWLFT
ncbi:MAG: DMT family transporter, partial [Bacteroidota bacterium]|nr:DMT family transporter [Candidatus Kapabacteria bacterium]MDW8220545.1 DMT family transporter [Bacteroidota bacterium]